MPETRGELRTPVGFRDDGTVRALALTDADELKVSANATVLADILTALQLIDDLRNALDSVDTDELVVNVDQSVLPTGAATAAHQATMITALQLIDDLRGCLNSVDTDVLITKVSASVLPTGAATSAAQATALTELQAKLETADLELVSKILSTGPHGWIGGALQKQPLMLGFSGGAREIFTGTSVGAGNTDADSTPVPAGEIHVINFISMYHDDPTARATNFYANNGANNYAFAGFASLAQYGIAIDTTSIILEEDDFIRVKVWGLANTKGIVANLWGNRIDIDQ